MGMVHAYKNGKLNNAPGKVKEVAKHISDEDARDFAKTKTGKLPEKKTEKTASFLQEMFMRGFIDRVLGRI
jgi:hypothetical protein